MASQARRTFLFLSSQYAQVGLNVISGVLLVPIYLSHIDAATYGAWLATGEILSWLVVIDPGIGAALQQRIAVAVGEGDTDAAGRFAGAGQLVNSVLASVFLLVGLWARSRLGGWLALPQHVMDDGVIEAYSFALFGGALTFLAVTQAGIAIGMQRPHALGGVLLFATAVSMLVSVTFVLRGHGVVALGYGALARGTIQVVGYQIVAFSAARELGVRMRAELRGFRELFGLSLYTALSQLASVLSTRIDAVLAARVVGPEAAAALTLTRRGPSMLVLIAERPSFTLMPVIGELKGAGEIDRARSITTRVAEASLWAAGLGAAGFLGLNESFVALWVGSSLFIGAAANWFACTAIAIRVVTQSFANYCMALGNIEGNGVARLIEAVVYASFAIAGAHAYGVVGMVAAELLALLCISTWYYPRRWSVMLRVSRAEQTRFLIESAKVTVSAGLVGFLASRLSITTWPRLLMAALGVAASYGAVLWLWSDRFRAGLRLGIETTRRLLKR